MNESKIVSCINVVVLTGEDECYLGYGYKVRHVSYGITTHRIVTVKYGNPMTLKQYREFYKTPEAKAQRKATYESQPVMG